MIPTRSTKDGGLAALACTECRKHHLKCDANKPTCSRCSQNGVSCQYLPSRRGGRRKPRNNVTSQRSVGIVGSSVSVNSRSSSDGDRLTMEAQSPDRVQSVIQRVFENPSPPLSTATDLNNISPSTRSLAWTTPQLRNDLIRGPASQTAGSDEDERFRRLYYENFHIAHPVLVPSSFYIDRSYPLFLKLVVAFAGSCYVTSSRSQQLKDRAFSELSFSTDRSPSMVQAWLIYAIVMFARSQESEAQDALSRSIEIAVELGMNRRDFTSPYQPDSWMEAESMRRTWWELYVTNVCMAVSIKSLAFPCCTLSSDVALPCEESKFSTGSEVSETRCLLDFKRRVFSAEDAVFSSFSYRIEACTILCRVLVLNRLRDHHRDHLQAVENALVSWVNHLPPQKLEIVDSYGNVDEMMFQAHSIIAHAHMLLHLPRSDLQSLLTQPDDNLWPSPRNHSLSNSARLVHSMKSIEGSTRISDLISICPNFQKHSPFIIPASALCGLIQLATSKKHSEECFDHHCNRVTLILGCLKSAKRTWSLAESTYHQVRSHAAEVLSDSIEKWNAEPLAKTVSTMQSQANESERGTQDLQQLTMPISDGQDLLLPQLSSGIADPVCYNGTFFNFISDFNME